MKRNFHVKKNPYLGFSVFASTELIYIYLAKNPGELKTMKVGFESWTDPNFYR